MKTKICSKCGMELPLECFSKDKRKKDGLDCRCKSCRKQYYADNAEHIKQCSKQYKKQRYSTIEGYAYFVRCNNLYNDRKYGRCGKDEDILPPLEYYIWALQQPDFYDGKQYHWSEMGLDRIYNDKPHTFANVVPCSTKNNNRRQKMSFEEFCKIMGKKEDDLPW